ncbi:MAG: prepilin-type N-terminal cleavage/methylation domain-containing protein [Planctomycetota bacterium]
MKKHSTALGFTLVEMLVAMAVTLLIMAALARSFGYVGQRVQSSRGEVNLSNQLRDIQMRMTEDLDGLTVTLDPMAPDDERQGYLVYHEGPVTDATSSLFRAFVDGDGELKLNDSRYGDFDDYLAFTAVATGDNWFSGKVPRYLLDQREAASRGVSYTLPNPSDSAFEPVVVRSKYAEIVYFVSPEYDVSSLPAAPAYVDSDGDTDFGVGNDDQNGIPDRMTIHRRVLLIRPDLNIQPVGGGEARLPIQVYQPTAPRSGPDVPFMRADDWPNATMTTVNANANRSQGWLYGMAGVHQQCDLSLRRVMATDGSFTAFVAANSLKSLTEPQNRFAHVRAPGGLVGGGSVIPSSMPILALDNPVALLNATTVDGARIAPPFSGAVVTPLTLNGFIRPEFVLGYDRAHFDVVGDAWGLERSGEDVLTNNVLALDVRVYDQRAPVFTTSERIAVEPGDPAYREVVRTEAIAVANNSAYTPNMTRGAFVDLGYGVLAGGTVRGWLPRRADRRATANDTRIPPDGAFLVTPFSGIRSYSSSATLQTAYPPSLGASGKFVASGTSVFLLQMTFDTFTESFERDGLLQAPNLNNASPVGNLFGGFSANADLGSNGLDEPPYQNGADDLTERETAPPFINRPQSLRVSVRIGNPSTQQIQQTSVVYRDEG